MNHDHAYDRPIPIAEGIYWVGFYEERTNLHCNPYLIIEKDQAVLIDGGSRPDFAVVMMKILQAGVDPKQIMVLIYQHYDPDLCGSMPNIIDLCENADLRVISDSENNVFINYYIEKEKHHLIKSIDEYESSFAFQGRILQFFKTPYSHSAGSFVTYDPKTKTLFSGDLFGSFSQRWDLFAQMDEACFTCKDYNHCASGKTFCPLPDILSFHQKIMPSGKSLRYAMQVIKELDIQVIAPQHGSVFKNSREISFLIHKLEVLEEVGIDAFL